MSLILQAFIAQLGEVALEQKTSEVKAPAWEWVNKERVKICNFVPFIAASAKALLTATSASHNQVRLVRSSQ